MPITNYLTLSKLFVFSDTQLSNHKNGYSIKIRLGLSITLPGNSKVREVTQSCPTLCDPMDCSLPCSSIHGIFQARVLEWGAISFSRGSSQSRDRTQVSHIVGRCFTVWATREALKLKLAEDGYDPSTSGLWAQHSSTLKRIFSQM